jgi:hypothetical protein
VGYGFERSGSYGGQAYTTDKEGNKQETFSMFDTVYLTGTQQYRHWSFEYPMIVPLYMFEDRDWSGGESLDLYERFGSTQITLSEGGSHNQSIWEPSQGLFPGSYDVIIDVDQDGFYSRANDLSLGFSVGGFLTVPEVSFGSISIILISLLSYLIARFRVK